MASSKRNIYKHEVQTLKKDETIEQCSDKCPNKDRHAEYIDMNDLKNLLQLKDEHFSKFISAFGDLAGKIQVKNGENLAVYGSCFVQKVEKMDKISCETAGCECKAWGKVTVTTAYHLIQDEGTGKACIVSLFDDLGGEREVKKLQGLKTHSRDKDGDWCALVCVTHDLDLLDRLKEMLDVYWELGRCLKEKYQNSEHNIVIIVSHPHGGPKRLSIGKAIVKDKAREVREDQDWCYYSYDTLTCDGSSGAPVYILGKWNDGFGYWFDHQHNHSGVDRNGNSRSTVGVESLFGLAHEKYKSIELNTRVSSNAVIVETLKKNNINADDLDDYLVAINSANKTDDNFEHALLKTQQKRRMENNGELVLKEGKILFHQDPPIEYTTLALSSLSLTEKRCIAGASDNVDCIIQKTDKASTSPKLNSRIFKRIKKIYSKAKRCITIVPRKQQTKASLLACVNMTRS